MDYLSSISSAFLARSQAQYSQINQQINRLIEDLGQKMQKELVVIEEKILNRYKQSLIESQETYKNLQEKRSGEVIKENILNLKSLQERIYEQESTKSLEFNNAYDKLKVELKKNNQYQNQLALQIKFLTKQCHIARKKSQILDEEFKQNQQKRNKRQQFKILSKTLNSSKSHQILGTEGSQSYTNGQIQRRMRNKIDNLKEYLQQLSAQQNSLQTIFNKYDLNSYKSNRQRLSLIQTVFQDRQFKKFIFNILFGEETLSNKKIADDKM